MSDDKMTLTEVAEHVEHEIAWFEPNSVTDRRLRAIAACVRAAIAELAELRAARDKNDILIEKMINTNAAKNAEIEKLRLLVDHDRSIYAAGRDDERRICQTELDDRDAEIERLRKLCDRAGSTIIEMLNVLCPHPDKSSNPEVRKAADEMVVFLRELEAAANSQATGPEAT